jgi:hypothetical protein
VELGPLAALMSAAEMEWFGVVFDFRTTFSTVERASQYADVGRLAATNLGRLPTGGISQTLKSTSIAMISETTIME